MKQFFSLEFLHNLSALSLESIISSWKLCPSFSSHICSQKVSWFLFLHLDSEGCKEELACLGHNANNSSVVSRVIYEQARLGRGAMTWLCLNHATCWLGWKLSPHLPLPNFSLKNGCFTDKLSGAMKDSKPWRGEEIIFYKAVNKKSSGDSSQ